MRGSIGTTANMGRVPLTIVTGPANAEKARVVLDGYRAALARDEEPILVVPTLADVERYRDELAAGGVVFGAHVVRFAWLIDEIARRGGVRGRPLPELARERVAAAAVAATPLRVLASSAATGGFTAALLRLVDELEEARVTPQRLTQALRAWADRTTRVAARTPTRSRASTAPTAAGSSGCTAATGRCTPAPRSTRCAPNPARGAPRRSSSTASTTSRRCSATPSRRSPRPART